MGQILKKQLEAQSEVKQNRLSNEADEPSTKELLALLLDEVKCTKRENQMLVTKLQVQSEKRFMEMITKLACKLNGLLETSEETKFVLQTENKNLKKLAMLNAYVNALELAHNQTSAKPNTPTQHNNLEDEKKGSELKNNMECLDSAKDRKIDNEKDEHETKENDYDDDENKNSEKELEKLNACVNSLELDRTFRKHHLDDEKELENDLYRDIHKQVNENIGHESTNNMEFLGHSKSPSNEVVDRTFRKRSSSYNDLNPSVKVIKLFPKKTALEVAEEGNEDNVVEDIEWAKEGDSKNAAREGTIYKKQCSKEAYFAEANKASIVFHDILTPTGDNWEIAKGITRERTNYHNID